MSFCCRLARAARRFFSISCFFALDKTDDVLTDDVLDGALIDLWTTGALEVGTC